MERVTAFGQNYRTLKSLATDPRCIVPYQTLRYRYKVQKWTAEDAAKTPRIIQLCVWNQIFQSLRDIAKDNRCKVSYKTLLYRCSVHTPLHIAVLDHEEYIAWKRANV